MSFRLMSSPASSRAVFSGRIVLLVATLLWLLVVMFAGGGRASAQEPASAGVTADVLSPEEVQRRKNKRAMEEALAKIREQYNRQDYQGVLDQIDAAEKIDPSNTTLKMYRDWAKERLLAGPPVVREPIVKDGGTTTVISVPGRPPTVIQLDTNPPKPVVATSTPAANAAAPAPGSSPGPQVVSTANDGDGLSLKKILGIAVLAVAAIAGALLVVGKVRSRRSSVQEIGDESIPLLDEVEEDVESSPKPVAGLSGGTPGLFGTDTAELSDSSLVETRPESTDLEKEEPESPSGAQPIPHASLLAPSLSAPDFSTPEFATAEPSAPVPSPQISSDIPAITPVYQAGGSGEGTNDIPSIAIAPPAIDLPGFEPTPAVPAMPRIPDPSKTVSFEDLGIVLTPDPPVTAPIPPPAEPAAAPPPPPMGIPEIRLSDIGVGAAPEPPPISKSPSTDDLVIRLDAFMPSEPKAAETAPTLAKPPGEAIAMEDLLLGKFPGAPSNGEDETGSARAETQGGPQPAVQPEPSEKDLDSVYLSPALKQGATPAGAPAPPPEFMSPEDTFHSQETLRLAPGGQISPAVQEEMVSMDNELAETRAQFKPASPELALDATKSMPGSESVYVAGPDLQRDDRSEKMFREQYDRGIEAFNQKNWKQAVHYLSVAAAIQSDNEEVREKLRIARENKRAQDK
ncbi:MAG: hypothetical protein K1X53_02250 [Candidatus Sumerlaeaceae bacterium]|nr:hypothetical protein [Candidatus Sumerlaeaceae bacterium]